MKFESIQSFEGLVDEEVGKLRVYRQSDQSSKRPSLMERNKKAMRLYAEEQRGVKGPLQERLASLVREEAIVTARTLTELRICRDWKPEPETPRPGTLFGRLTVGWKPSELSGTSGWTLLAKVTREYHGEEIKGGGSINREHLRVNGVSLSDEGQLYMWSTSEHSSSSGVLAADDDLFPLNTINADGLEFDNTQLIYWRRLFLRRLSATGPV